MQDVRSNHEVVVVLQEALLLEVSRDVENFVIDLVLLLAKLSSGSLEESNRDFGIDETVKLKSPISIETFNKW